MSRIVKFEWQRPNVALAVEVPEDYEAKARSLGHDPAILLWDFAENFCARYPLKVTVRNHGRESSVTLPLGVIPFPLQS